MKKVRKITRLFRYDLNQIPYDYTEEMTNRFKGLDSREVKGKGENERYIHLNAEFQIARRGKKAFLVISAKK